VSRRPEDPLELFAEWMHEAEESEPRVPDAMALATADSGGRPSVRLVLLKSWGPEGFVFYTNKGSQKARELAENPWASGVLHWKSSARQVRVDGPVEELTDAESDAYFATRARASKIGAWASKQSEPMSERFEFEKRIAEYGARYAVGPVPRPPFWGGYRILARSIEFWEDKAFRLHIRFAYDKTESGWECRELYP